MAFNAINQFLKSKTTYTKEMLEKNLVLKDILDSKHWNAKVDWKLDWIKIPKGKVILGANKNQLGYFEDESEFFV